MLDQVAATSGVELPGSVLDELERLCDRADPVLWRSMVEGRDHCSGDSFIQVGRDDDRAEDMYVSRDSGPAGPAELDESPWVSWRL
jgi:hypothetical protein